MIAYGLWLTDANGHEHALKLLEAFVRGGLLFAGMVDDEGKHPTRWKNVKDHMGDLLHQWNNGCLEQNVIPYFQDDELHSLIKDPNDALTGERLRTLADRLKVSEKNLRALKVKQVKIFGNLLPMLPAVSCLRELIQLKRRSFRVMARFGSKQFREGRNSRRRPSRQKEILKFKQH